MLCDSWQMELQLFYESYKIMEIQFEIVIC